MTRIYLILSLIFTANLFAQVSGGEREFQYNPRVLPNGEMNQVINGSCNLNTLNITDADTILSRNTTSSKGYFGANCVIDADADGEFIEFEVYDLGGYPEGGNCEAGFVYYGDASLYEAVVYQGSSPVSSVYDLTNVSSGVQKIEGIYYTCGDGSTRPKLRIYSNSASAAAASFYGAQMGEAWSLGTVAQATLRLNAYGGSTTISSTGEVQLTATPINTDAPFGEFASNALTMKSSGWLSTLLHVRLGGYSSGVQSVLIKKNGTQIADCGVSVAKAESTSLNYNMPVSSCAFEVVTGDVITAWVSNDTDDSYSALIENWKAELFPSASEQVQKIGAPYSEPTSYTPTFAGLGTVTNVDIKAQCIQGSLHIQGRATAGTSTAAPATMSLPSGFTAAANTEGTIYVGTWIFNTAGSSQVKTGAMTKNGSATNTVINFNNTDFSTAIGPFAATNGDALFTGGVFSVNAIVPVTADSPCPRTPAPLLKQGVTQPSDGVEDVYRAVITPTSAGTCTINSQNNWLSATTSPNAAGDCTLTLLKTLSTTTDLACSGSSRSVNTTGVLRSVAISVPSTSTIRVTHGFWQTSGSVQGLDSGAVSIKCERPN